MRLPIPCPPLAPSFHWRGGFLAALALALGLSGCAGLSDSAQTSRNPEATAPSLIEPTWWTGFNDLLLTQLVQQALRANTSIRSAQAALQQARAARDVKAASNGPSLGLSGSVQRSQTESRDASNSFQAGLDARWELDFFGGNRAALAASEADTLATEANLRDVQVSIAAEVALAYIQLRGTQAQMDIAQNNLGSQQETLQITQWRAQAGLVTTLEVEQSQSAVAQTAAQLPALQTNLTNLRHSLAILTGQRPLELDSVLTKSGNIPTSDQAFARPIAANTLRQRADVRAAEHRISAALARLAAADAARYPSFNLGGSLGLSALTLTGLANGATLAGSLLGSVSVPLFDGGAAQSQVLAQEAALEQTRAAYQATVLAALKEVEGALVTIQNNAQRLQLLQVAASSASNAALLAKQRYASGLIDFQTVLQTQRTLLSAQDSVASLQATRSADVVRLIKALGGGWR